MSRAVHGTESTRALRKYLAFGFALAACACSTEPARGGQGGGGLGGGAGVQGLAGAPGLPTAGTTSVAGAAAGALGGAGGSSAAGLSGGSAAGAGAPAGGIGADGGSAGAAGNAGSGAGGEGGSGGSGASCGVPTSFAWSSTGPIIAPKSDATHNLAAIKDPTVVFFEDQWLIYATTASTSGGYDSVFLSFTDWSAAGSAPQQYLQGGVAPQVFYFAPQNLWYRVYEWPDAYDTSTDPTDPQSWSNRKTFYPSEPSIVAQNKGGGGGIDYWVICDDDACYLFFSDDNGHLYRARTSLDDFPNNFEQPVIVLSDPVAGRLFEACNVYSMKGTGQYLLLVEAFDGGSGGKRYFRSWTAPALDGTWTPLQAEFSTPFASAQNVTFEGDAWTQDLSHGEMLRSGVDQKLELDTCKLQFLYQGKDPSAGGGYNTLPWRLGLLTQTP